ncbi:hypothetical protein AB6A40_009344 [Gnathostoma spinigerum]|uniref:Uncharacterized protein n=1 Tax=Gnathostoma spinigerum TaxID=75299 RepID=A0ABD6F1F8_9BILA
MASLFSRLITLDDVEKRLQQLQKEVEKLEMQSMSGNVPGGSRDRNNFNRRCLHLKKNIDNYAERIESMREDSKNANWSVQKDNARQCIQQLSDRLAALLAPKKDTTLRGESSGTSVQQIGKEEVTNEDKGLVPRVSQEMQASEYNDVSFEDTEDFSRRFFSDYQ